MRVQQIFWCRHFCTATDCDFRITGDSRFHIEAKSNFYWCGHNLCRYSTVLFLLGSNNFFFFCCKINYFFFCTKYFLWWRIIFYCIAGIRSTAQLLYVFIYFLLFFFCSSHRSCCSVNFYWIAQFHSIAQLQQWSFLLTGQILFSAADLFVFYRISFSRSLNDEFSAIKIDEMQRENFSRRTLTRDRSSLLIPPGTSLFGDSWSGLDGEICPRILFDKMLPSRCIPRR